MAAARSKRQNVFRQVPNRSPTSMPNSSVGSVIFLRRQITFLYRLHELVAYAFQIGSAMASYLVLPGCHPRCEVLVGDGAVQPVGKVSSFEMVFECLLVEMSIALLKSCIVAAAAMDSPLVVWK
jgi:hypothetical protein